MSQSFLNNNVIFGLTVAMLDHEITLGWRATAVEQACLLSKEAR